jgi:hypothetical protein
MSDITINSGESINVSVSQPTLQNTIVIPRPTTSLSIKGVTGGGGDAHYMHVQGTAEAIWEVTHNLNKRPSVTVVDSMDKIVFGEVEYVDNNNVRLIFAGAFSGKAYFN